MVHIIVRGRHEQFWSLCPTFIFASGTHFVELSAGLAPSSSTEGHKVKIRNESQQEHFDAHTGSRLQEDMDTSGSVCTSPGIWHWGQAAVKMC